MIARWALVLCTLVATSAAWAGPKENEAAALLDAWRLSDADKALKDVPAGDAKELLRARLELMRSDAAAAVKRLEPLVAKAQGEAGYEARVLLGRALQALGKKQEAFQVLDAMAEDYNADQVTTAPGLMWLGVGLMLTDYPKNAHRVFREAVDKDGKLALAKRLWADLYASKYDYRKADPLYKEVGADTAALVGRARVAIDSDRAFTEAVELMTPLVAAQPECVPCHNVLALVDLHNELPERARDRLLARSLAVAPADAEALALLATAYYLMHQPKDFAATEQRALAANPKASGFYTTIAEHAEREHRYDEAIALLEKALALDPEDWGALGMLGQGYSRMGEDDKAKATLDKAFDGDPYNVRVYNLLAHFYDKADKRFTWIEAPPMRIRVDMSEAPVLGAVLPPLLLEAEKTLTKKYAFTPKQPLHIEVFKDPSTFAVRSTGLPGLAAHGICFGHVITARSPSAGDFNWGEVLWHELAHVYHIQMSRGRVPRWFTEGLAVLESLEARPQWEREQDRELLGAFRAKKLRGVGDFNLAFTQAKSIDDILVAYYQAYQVTRFIRDEWGFPKMRRMLELWGKEVATPEVVKQALGVEVAELDRRFFVWLEGRLAYLAAAYPFDEVPAEGAPVDPLRARFDAAMKAMQSTATAAAAKAEWEALRAAGKAGVLGLSALAAIAADAGDFDAAAALYAEAAALDPNDIKPLLAWLVLLDRTGKKAEARAVRLKIARLEQNAVELVVKALEDLGDGADAKKDVLWLTEQALHTAPFSLEVHLVSARALKALGFDKQAKRSAALALLIEPGNAEATKLAQ